MVRVHLYLHLIAHDTTKRCCTPVRAKQRPHMPLEMIRMQWPFIHLHSHFHLIAHDMIKRKDTAAPPAPKTSHAPGEDLHAVGIY